MNFGVVPNFQYAITTNKWPLVFLRYNDQKQLDCYLAAVISRQSIVRTRFRDWDSSGPWVATGCTITSLTYAQMTAVTFHPCDLLGSFGFELLQRSADLVLGDAGELCQ